MNKLEPNMYVRTLFGIKKIDHIDNKKTVWKYLYKINDDNEFYALSDNDVIKASYNIIDLIEVGDYVNGYLIDYINLTCKTPFLRSERPYRVDNTLYSTLKEKGRDYNQPLHFYNEDIKSIVTKEQISSMEYRLGE